MLDHKTRFVSFSEQFQLAVKLFRLKDKKFIDVVDLRQATPGIRCLRISFDEFMEQKVAEREFIEAKTDPKSRGGYICPTYFHHMEKWPEDPGLSQDGNARECRAVMCSLSEEFCRQWLWNPICKKNPFAIAWLKNTYREDCFTLLLTDAPLLIAWGMRCFLHPERLGAFAVLSTFDLRDAYAFESFERATDAFMSRGGGTWLYSGDEARLAHWAWNRLDLKVYLVNPKRYMHGCFRSYKHRDLVWMPYGRLVHSDGSTGTRIFVPEKEGFVETALLPEEESYEVVRCANKLVGIE